MLFETVLLFPCVFGLFVFLGLISFLTNTIVVVLSCFFFFGFEIWNKFPEVLAGGQTKSHAGKIKHFCNVYKEFMYKPAPNLLFMCVLDFIICMCGTTCKSHVYSYILVRR